MNQDDLQRFLACVDELARFHGLPPYSGAGNPTVGSREHMARIGKKYSEAIRSQASAFIDNEKQLYRESLKVLASGRRERAIEFLTDGEKPNG